jgi:hypothetical protein
MDLLVRSSSKAPPEDEETRARKQARTDITGAVDVFPQSFLQFQQARVTLSLPPSAMAILQQVPFPYVATESFLTLPMLSPVSVFPINPPPPLTVAMAAKLQLVLKKDWSKVGLPDLFSSLTQGSPLDTLLHHLSQLIAVTNFVRKPTEPARYLAVVKDGKVHQLCRAILAIAPPLFRWPPDPIFQAHETFMNSHSFRGLSQVHIGVPGIFSDGLFSKEESSNIWHTGIPKLWYTGFLSPTPDHIPSLYGYSLEIVASRWDPTAQAYFKDTWYVLGNPSTLTPSINMQIQRPADNCLFIPTKGLPGTISFRKRPGPSREFLFAYEAEVDFFFVDNIVGKILCSLGFHLIHHLLGHAINAFDVQVFANLLRGLAHLLSSNQGSWNQILLVSQFETYQEFMNTLLRHVRGFSVDLSVLHPPLHEIEFMQHFIITNEYVSQHMLEVLPDPAAAQHLILQQDDDQEDIIWVPIPSQDSLTSSGTDPSFVNG